MVIDRIQYKKMPPKLNLKFNLRTVDLFCRYVLQRTFVTSEHLVNLRNLLNRLDMEYYQNDPEMRKRFDFIYKALEARLQEGCIDRDVILEYINGGLTYQIDFLDYNNLDLCQADITYITSVIMEALKYSFLYEKSDEMIDLFTQLNSTDFSNRGNIVQRISDNIDILKNNFIKTEVDTDPNESMFSLEPGIFESSVTRAHDIISNPSYRLITGMQGFNEMLGGGFESGRAYLILGTAGGGKSFTLLNIMKQMKKYNPHIQTKNPKMRPAIVLLTMENSIVETIQRLFSMINGSDLGMESYTAEEVISILRQTQEFTLTDSNNIDIIIKYKPNRSVSTAYLDSLYESLLERGIEMVCLIQDHAKRIRSVEGNTDIRIELGDVINEMKSFAIKRQIPVITNSHLNRDAAKIIEDALRKNNQDIGKLLGKSNVGESMLMIDNIDCAISITEDYDREFRKYLGLNLLKMRGKMLRTYIAQPFLPGNSMTLVEDLGGVPQFKESLHENVYNLQNSSVVKVSAGRSIMEELNSIIDHDIDKKDNVFANKEYSMEVDKFQPNVQHPVVFAKKPLIFFEDEALKYQNFNQDLEEILKSRAS